MGFQCITLVIIISIRTNLENRAALILLSRFDSTPLGVAFGIVGTELVLAPDIPSKSARGGALSAP
jgi:DASS family divalent anion:Na+ symporter